MTLGWDELSAAIGPDYFTVNNAATRLAALETDPWEDFWKAAKPLKVGGTKRRAA
jgi:bifunctional non-homologous end joining protein LigD